MPSFTDEMTRKRAFPFPRILDFLGKVSPFDALSQEELIHAAQHMEMGYHRKGEVVIRRSDSPPASLYVIYVGSVRINISVNSGEEILVDLRSEGDVFGATSILQGKEALFDVTAEEDLVTFLLPADLFKKLVNSHPAFGRFFSSPLARNFSAAGRLIDTRFRSDTPLLDVGISWIEKRVADLMSTDLLKCDPDTSVRKAAQLMSQRGVGSILILRESEVAIGILTDRDLRVKVLAEGIGLDTPVTAVMSYPVHTIDPHSYVFDALVEMSRHGVRHLVVSEENHVVGMISEHDLQIHTGDSPLGLVGEIERAKSLDALVEVRPEIDRAIERFLSRGGSIQAIMDLATELNDRVTLRVLGITEREMEKQGAGRVPVPYSWMAMGSEGRREQTLLTDQDNALVFADVPEKHYEEVRNWFLCFSGKVVDGLVRYGIPRCPHDFTASNPEWCHSEQKWESRFLNWMQDPRPKVLRTFSVFADFRAIFTQTDFLRSLRDRLNEEVKADRRFIRFLARNGLYNRPPLGFFRQFVVEKSGQHKEKLNVKTKGLIPIISSVRVLALELGVKQTNTLQRMREIDKASSLDREFMSNLREAYGYMTYLRIKNHFDARATGEKADNFINPARLNTLERKMLKESFKLIFSLQEQMTSRYLTEFLVRP
jgi:CBS domain-containing protein